MAESLDAQLTVADVYAAALFGLARDADTIDEVRAELAELVKLHDAQPDFARFMESAIVDEDRRAARLEKLLRGKLSDLVLNTLLVMNAHGRAGFVRALARCFVLREEAHDNQVEVTATTAVELGKQQRMRVVQAAADISGMTPLVDFRVDADIVGGLILEIGDLRYDNSVRRQLRAAQGRLAQRGQRGLEVGAVE